MASPTTNVLIIGASRGIGRGLVSAFASYPNTKVIGTVRKTSDGDFQLPNATSMLLDLNKPDSVAAAAGELTSTPIDILVVNAGMGVAEPVLDLDEKAWQNYLDVNVTGPWRLVKTLLPSLRLCKSPHRKIVFTSSISGSMQVNYQGGASVRGAYAITKAAINMLALQLHQDLHESEGFMIVPIHPGWVDTALGNPGSQYQGAMPPDESARGIAKVVMGLKPEDSGRFLQFDGKELPW